MDLLSSLRRLFSHDHWANRETLISIQRAGEVDRACKLFAHILGAELLWLGRLQREDRKLAVWPELTLAQCAAQLPKLQHAWDEYLAGLDTTRLASIVAYVNSKGERWENTVSDILLHVPMHSSYHRGQVALVLRNTGAEPAYTDFIQAARTEVLMY